MWGREQVSSWPQLYLRTQPVVSFVPWKSGARDCTPRFIMISLQSSPIQFKDNANVSPLRYCHERSYTALGGHLRLREAAAFFHLTGLISGHRLCQKETELELAVSRAEVSRDRHGILKQPLPFLPRLYYHTVTIEGTHIIVTAQQRGKEAQRGKGEIHWLKNPQLEKTDQSALQKRSTVARHNRQKRGEGEGGREPIIIQIK